MTRICSIPGCSKKHRGHGWCANHYAQWYRHGDPLYVAPQRVRLCEYLDCQNKHHANGLCMKHHLRRYKYGDPSIVKRRAIPNLFPYGQMPKVCLKDDCERPAFGRGLCVNHYREWEQWGSRGSQARALCPLCGERYYLTRKEFGACYLCRQNGRRSTRSISRRQPGFWNRETILLAGQEWLLKFHDPPSANDWRYPKRPHGFPDAKTVQDHFGSWSNFTTELTKPIKIRLNRQGVMT